MTIQQLKYLIEVANCGSINKAAKNLFVSQPGISKAIRDLEQDLDIQIFNRENSKKLQFTVKGKELLRYARDLLDQVENIESTFADQSQKEFLRLVISSQHYTFVVQAFIDFMKEHDGNRYKFLLRESKTSQIIEDVSTHQSNLGIISLTSSTEDYMKKYLTGKNLEFTKFKEFGPHAFIRKGHPLDGKKSIKLQDLSGYPYVSYEQDSHSLNFREESIMLKADQSVLVLERATMNNIICNTDSFNIGTGYVAGNFTDSRLISVPISDLNDKLIVGWIKLKGIQLSDHEKEFIARCEDYLK